MTDRDASHPSAGRWHVAEWVTLIVSAVIVAAIAVFLIVQAARGRSPIVEVRAQLRVDRTEARGGSFVVPLEVENAGARTLTRVVIGVEDEGSAAGQRDVELTYLAEGVTRTVYVVLERDPRAGAAPKVWPLHYAID